MLRDYQLNRSQLAQLKRQATIYEHYVPVLKRKREHLHHAHEQSRAHLKNARIEHQNALTKITPYLPLFADDSEVSIEKLVVVDKIATTTTTCTDVTLQRFLTLTFKEIALPVFHTAPWLIRAVPLMKAYLVSEIKLRYALDEEKIIHRELCRTTQKMNRLDKVLIPSTKMAIAKITIARDDEHRAMMVHRKIAKTKNAQVRDEVGAAL